MPKPAKYISVSSNTGQNHKIPLEPRGILLCWGRERAYPRLGMLFWWLVRKYFELRKSSYLRVLVEPRGVEALSDDGIADVFKGRVAFRVARV